MFARPLFLFAFELFYLVALNEIHIADNVVLIEYLIMILMIMPVELIYYSIQLIL